MSEILAEVFVPGRPRPKGSLDCKGGNGRAHRMEENNPESKPWRRQMAAALTADRDRRGFVMPWAAPVDVAFTAFFDPPHAGVITWPVPCRTVDGGDKDKLERNVLDALQDQVGDSLAVLADDSLVVGGFGEKVFTEQAGQQGIWIRVTTVEMAELRRRRRLRNAGLAVLREQLGMAMETGF